MPLDATVPRSELSDKAYRRLIGGKVPITTLYLVDHQVVGSIYALGPGLSISRMAINRAPYSVGF